MKKSIIFLVVTILIFSCGNKKVDELKTAVDETTKKMAKSFSQLAKINEKNANKLQDILENPENYDLSTNKLDIENGGNFAWFGDWMYWSKKDLFDNSNVIYIDCEKPHDDNEAIKRMIKMFVIARSSMQDIEYPFGITTNLFMDTKIGDFLTNQPKYDCESALPNLPPGLSQFPWYSNVNEENNPNKKSIWGDIAINMVNGKWSIPVSFPVYNKDKFSGVALTSVNLIEMSDAYFEEVKQNLFFVGSKLSVLDITESVKDEININYATDFYMIDQLKDNPQLTEQLKLTDKSQPAGIQALGKKINNGETEFSNVIGENSYFFYINKIEGPGIYVVGFVKE